MMELLRRFSVYSSQPHVTDEAKNHYFFIFDYDAKFPSLSISEKIEISKTWPSTGISDKFGQGIICVLVKHK